MPQKLTFKRVLVALDGSEVSLRAVDHVARIAKDENALLLALHVVASPQFEVSLPEYYENARLGTAYTISFINAVRSNNYLEAFSNKLMTLVLYVSIIPFGRAVAGTGLQFGTLYTSQAPTPFFNLLLGLRVPVSVLAKDSLPFIIGSLIVLVASHPIQIYRSPHERREMLSAFTSGLLEIAAKSFEFFTNVLSYVRLGVLLITTYVLGSLVAGVLSFGILGGLLAAFLNILVIAMEGLIVYIQDMRLHLYEWLSKFYIGTGIPFRPMKSGGEFCSLSFENTPF